MVRQEPLLSPRVDHSLYPMFTTLNAGLFNGCLKVELTEIIFSSILLGFFPKQLIFNVINCNSANLLWNKFDVVLHNLHLKHCTVHVYQSAGTCRRSYISLMLFWGFFKIPSLCMFPMIDIKVKLNIDCKLISAISEFRCQRLEGINP